MATRDPLQPIIDALHGYSPLSTDLARNVDAALRSAVRAVTPGRQQKKNLAPLMDAARAAFVRTLRRRAKRCPRGT